MDQFKGQIRLPKFAVPSRYDLTLKLDLSASTFSGTVLIDLSILGTTHFLVLNALEIAIGDVCFISSDEQRHHPSNVALDSADEMLILAFDEALHVGEGVLKIEFSGFLNEHLKGLYRGTYEDGGVKKNMAATQFQAVDARRCFPCWDEPAIKATFKIKVEVPAELTALSNMPILKENLDGHLKTVYFEETPIMSTYLVAIVVGLYDYVEEVTVDGTKVRSYCPVGKSDKGKLALDVAVKVLDLFTKYFEMPYPLPKLDMVSVADYPGGAMENNGLIIYRENELLYDESYSTAANKQWLVIVVSHEVAHHWFGNLVTMEWWTHLWLNEGFATWISYLATGSLYPEWEVWTQFLGETNGGLRMDSLEQSHPIEVEINHARSIDEVFDAISYKKGSGVIRMLEYYIGDQIFKKSLGSYMKRYACKNAATEDLWAILSEESGVQVNAMMDTWTKQKGYPVIFVKIDDHVLEFEQLQFLSMGLKDDKQWIIPVTLSVGSYDRQKKFLLETKVGRLDISELLCESDEQLWIKVNVEQTGFYRVKYEDKLSAQLRVAIKNNWLSASDKFGILDDTYALCEACELPLSSLLTLMDVFRTELNFIALRKLVDICFSVTNIATDAIPGLVNQLKQIFINLLMFSAERLGWESKSGESHLNTMLREQVLLALATFGDDKTVQEAIERFQTFLGDRKTPVLPVGVRKAVYIAVIKNASSLDRSGFESLLKVYKEADALQEKVQVLGCIASCPDEKIVLETLNLFMSNEIPEQDVFSVLRGLSLEGREIAWTWLKENWDAVLKKWGSGLLLTVIVKDILTPFSCNEKADEMESFFERQANPSIAMTVKRCVEQIRIKARWVQSIKNEQSLEELIKQLAIRT